RGGGGRGGLRQEPALGPGAVFACAGLPALHPQQLRAEVPGDAEWSPQGQALGLRRGVPQLLPAAPRGRGLRDLPGEAALQGLPGLGSAAAHAQRPQPG
ncbi:unnamed protein product, partial [Effrenium voratum]